MELHLKRFASNPTDTLGLLFIGGKFFAFTLEDRYREVKIAGTTRIPAGRYRVTIAFSPHFQREMPLLNNVPEFSGILIHPGNTEFDTEGCILVANGAVYNPLGDSGIVSSRMCFDRIYPVIEAGVKAGDTFITIEDN
jgi:hypothetical protein